MKEQAKYFLINQEQRSRIREKRGRELLLPTGEKIITYPQAIETIRAAKEKGLTTVYASGVFDVVHMGHIDMLRVAKKAGDILIVGVESDETVKFNKGEQRPLNDVGRRVDFLAELQSVNYVFAFEDMISYSQGGEIFRRRFEELAPDFVAVSTSENGLDKKMAQIQEAGCNIALITQRRSDSTTRLLRLVGYE